ncbi:hypothetical protein VE00_10699 [Pseudogymnoascus sp. WSF 3629]|nr:hypothetical protein VE00_10699 [Pseudogymnoascus sp. WSF 3629]
MASRQAAPSGLACMQCFKAKCKCVSRPDGDGCERCYHLKKQCQPSDSLRKITNAQRRHNFAARIGDLEGEVESLVKLLSLVAQSPSLSVTLRSAAREDETLAGYAHLLSQDDSDWPSNAADTAMGGDDDTATQPSRENSFAIDLSSPYAGGTTSDTLASTPLALDGPSTHDLETCVAIFRDKMLPCFSFTDISPNVTAQELQRDRPFLVRAILAVASPSREQKLAYGWKLKEVLAQTTLVQNQSSLDLLQGLLTFTAWSYDHMLNPTGTLSRLILLAISLACDLRLDKPLPSDEHMMKPMVDGSSEQENNTTKHWFVVEEQRAVLACYALSSIISIYFAQIDVMKWKPRMEESLRAIEANRECHSDVAFAFQVRLQLLAQKAVQVREQREWDSARVDSDTGPALSANFYIRTLQEQLHQLNESLPATLQRRGPLIMHMHYIELCMNETARTLYPNALQGPIPWPGGNSGNGASMSGADSLGYERLDFSWRSVGAIKAWMEMFFSLSPAECAGLSFIHMAQLARCLMVLYRLSTFVHPAWDCHLVRSTVDLLLVLDGVADKLELASSESGEISSEDQFMRLSRMMRKFRANAVSKMGQKTTAGTPWLNGDAVGGSEGAAVQNPTLSESMINLGDDAFLESIFGDFRTDGLYNK